MVRLACAFAIISFVRHNHPFTGGNVIQSDFVRANRFFTGGDDLSVVEVTKIWTDGKMEPTRLFAKFTLAAHLPLSVFYGTLPAKVALKKAHFGKGPRLECAPSHFACQSEFVGRNNLRNSVNWGAK